MSLKQKNEFQINWDAMRIRLEFTYQLLKRLDDIIHTGYFEEFGIAAKDAKIMEDSITTVVSYIAHSYCVDKKHLIDFNQWAISRDMAEIIADEFAEINIRMRIACEGLPFAAHLTDEKMILQDGMDWLIVRLKNLLVNG